jgi:hypothetical protein
MKHFLAFLIPSDPWHLVLIASAVFFVVLLNVTWYYRDRTVINRDAAYRRVRDGFTTERRGS